MNISMKIPSLKNFVHQIWVCAFAVLLPAFGQLAWAAPVSVAQTCEAKAVSKDGKPLHGAAKSAFMAKCNKDHQAQSCEEKAIDKNGKKLAGAAKNSFMKKCQAGT